MSKKQKYRITFALYKNYFSIILDKITSFYYTSKENCSLKGGENKMTTVKVGENESLESALKRFKRKCQKDGIIGDLRKKEAYDKPSVKRKKKSEAARKRARKRA